MPSVTIEPWILDQAADNIIRVSEQETSLMIPLVSSIPGVQESGSRWRWPELGPVGDPAPMSEENQTFPVLNFQRDARWVHMLTYGGRIAINRITEQDLAKELQITDSHFITSMARAFARVYDDVIFGGHGTGYGGFFGKCTVGVNGETDLAFGNNRGAWRGDSATSMVVPINHGSGASTKCTLEKLIRARYLLWVSEVSYEYEQMHCIIGPSDWEAMINTERQQNANYSGSSDALLRGVITATVGVNVHVSTRVDRTARLDSNNDALLPFFIKRGMGFAVVIGSQIDMTVDSNAPHITQIQFTSKFGGMRLGEDEVVQIISDR